MPLLGVNEIIFLVLHAVALFEALYPAGGVYHALFAGEEGMTLAAKLHFQFFLGGADGKCITAGAGDYCIIVIFGDVSFLSYYLSA